MKSSAHVLIIMATVLVGLLLLASCLQNNFERVSPTAPNEFALAQTLSPAASALEAALAIAHLNAALNKSSATPARVAAAPIYSITDLGTLGGVFSAALDLNAAGQIVGGARLANGLLHPFLYQNGQMIDLGTLGGNEGIASGINDAGDIVGQADNAQGWRRAFLYLNGVMTYIPTLGGTESRAGSINNSGQIVGRARIVATNYEHAFLYENAAM
ncbi:hypothetical protein HUU05_14745, partial [candidate division KSB1 bacterium]|nr:hypothetical protein [candidate division KSB1 bacterium]